LENGKGVVTDAGPPLRVYGVCSAYMAIRVESCTFRRNPQIDTLMAARDVLSDLCATGKPAQGKRREAPHVPLQSDTTVPKEDPIWAKMYCVLMFDIQLFAEHHHERFRSGPTSGRRSR
jgi:hypothetical protein